MDSYTLTRPGRTLPRLLILTVVLALIGTLGTLTAPRALAHDVLLETNPEDGAVLAETPEQISLTFSGELVEMNPLIIVSDAADDEVIADDPPQIDSRTATVSLPALDAGDYQVDWSVVSSDGHRIEGTYGFSIAAEVPSSPSPSPESVEDNDPQQSEASTPAPTSPSSEPAPTSEVDTNGSEAQESGSLPVWLMLALAVVLLGSVIIIVAGRRKR